MQLVFRADYLLEKTNPATIATDTAPFRDFPMAVSQAAGQSAQNSTRSMIEIRGRWSPDGGANRPWILDASFRSRMMASIQPFSNIYQFW